MLGNRWHYMMLFWMIMVGYMLFMQVATLSIRKKQACRCSDSQTTSQSACWDAESQRWNVSTAILQQTGQDYDLCHCKAACQACASCSWKPGQDSADPLESNQPLSWLCGSLDQIKLQCVEHKDNWDVQEWMLPNKRKANNSQAVVLSNAHESCWSLVWMLHVHDNRHQMQKSAHAVMLCQLISAPCAYWFEVACTCDVRTIDTYMMQASSSCTFCGCPYVTVNFLDSSHQ